MNDTEIEKMLFQQVEKPSKIHKIKIINVFENRYRINIYTQCEENNLNKIKIATSYFIKINDNKLEII